MPGQNLKQRRAWPSSIPPTKSRRVTPCPHVILHLAAQIACYQGRLANVNGMNIMNESYDLSSAKTRTALERAFMHQQLSSSMVQD